MFFYRMIRILHYILLLFPIITFGQTVLKGEVSNSGDKEGIHVYNDTFQKYTVTDENGKFQIAVAVDDIIVFSGIQYELKTVQITEKHVNNGFLNVVLTTKVNELDVVHIGYQLTGSLGIDAKYIETIVPMEIALTDSFRGLGKYNGVLTPDGQSAIQTNDDGAGGNILGLVGMFIPKKDKVVFPNIIPLKYTRDFLVTYYGGNFFSGHLKIPKVDEERFVQFTELDNIIVVSLRKRNKFELLHRILELRTRFEISE